VPLIISSTAVNKLEHSVYETALSLADQLQPEVDFHVSSGDRQIRLTDDGTAKLEELAVPLGGLWAGRLRREELVQQALIARHVFVRDRDYLVMDGKIQLVDEFSGRVLTDRSWERGLHQMVEAKEGVSLTSQQGARARITYQRFFRKYLRLAGMTGTAREVRGELWSVYRLTVVRIPTNRPSRRRGVPDRIFLSAEAKWDAVVARIAEIHMQGRPILVGTRSVAVSEHLARLLSGRGLPHQVLNARQDREEAAIIAQAGQPGRITVATNMAGRGTDIRLGPGVVELGGLHVIATERHESGRIDRQLFGRCGRQGDPGSYEAVTSLDDELVVAYGRGVWRWLASLAATGGRPLPRWLARLVIRNAQRTAERLHSRIRRDLLRADEQMETALAFSGHSE
jgi:preprotein translocase subunit SecA